MVVNGPFRILTDLCHHPDVNVNGKLIWRDGSGEALFGSVPRGLPVALDLLGEAPFMDLGRAVVDAEGADFAEHLLDDRRVGDAGAAHHLHAAVGDAHQRLRHRDLRSEEHTSELQSLMRISYAVFCLQKQKQPTYSTNT